MAFGVDVWATNRTYSSSTFALAGGPDKSICIRHMLCFHCLSCIRLCSQILACAIPNVQCALGYLTSWNTELPMVCDLLQCETWFHTDKYESSRRPIRSLHLSLSLAVSACNDNKAATSIHYSFLSAEKLQLWRVPI